MGKDAPAAADNNGKRQHARQKCINVSNHDYFPVNLTL